MKFPSMANNGWVYSEYEETIQPKEKEPRLNLDKYKGRVFAIPGGFTKWQIKDVSPYMNTLQIVDTMDRTDIRTLTFFDFENNMREVFF